MKTKWIRLLLVFSVGCAAEADNIGSGAPPGARVADGGTCPVLDGTYHGPSFGFEGSEEEWVACEPPGWASITFREGQVTMVSGLADGERCTVTVDPETCTSRVTCSNRGGGPCVSDDQVRLSLTPQGIDGVLVGRRSERRGQLGGETRCQMCGLRQSVVLTRIP